LSLDGSTVNVEDYPLLWIYETYYNTYKGNTFVLPTNAGNDIWAGDAIDYTGVNSIDLNGNSLTTNFSTTLMGKFKNIELLYLYDNSITFVDVTVLQKATVIAIYNNALTGNYDFTNNTLLTELNIRNNNITSVDVSTCLVLDTFSCQNNDLPTLDVTNNTALTELQAFSNDLPSIDVTNNTALTLLYLFSNDLTSIDLSNNVLLNTLYLQSNDLDDLDISNNTLLTNLRIQNNELDNLVNSQILIDLDGHGLSNGYLQSTIFGGGSLTTAGTTAKTNLQGKGWTIVGI
jgi:hypothetical protein